MNITNCFKCGASHEADERKTFGILEKECPLCNLAKKLGFEIDSDDDYGYVSKSWSKIKEKPKTATIDFSFIEPGQIFEFERVTLLRLFAHTNSGTSYNAASIENGRLYSLRAADSVLLLDASVETK